MATTVSPTIVIDLSNLGVALLEEGHYEAALIHFHRALGLIRQKLTVAGGSGNGLGQPDKRIPADGSNVGAKSAAAPSGPPSPSKEGRMFDLTESFKENKQAASRFVAAIESVPIADEDCQYDLTVSPSNPFHVYNRAFEFVPGFTSSLWSDPGNDQVYTAAVVLYNTALTYHRQAMEADTGRSASGLLRSAMTGYKFVVALVQDATYETDPDLYPLILGLWTNIGHISYHFHEIRDYANCLWRLGQILNATKPACPLTEEDRHFFFLNEMLSRSMPYQPAPAA